MHRFFSHIPLTPDLRLTSGDQFHQISHVFRAKKGDSLIFFEARDDDKVYEIIEVNKKTILLKQKEVIKKSIQNEKNIKVFQAYPNKIATMEFIIQKMVELGVHEIVFFLSEHSQIKGIPESKRSRISSIATEALEQSGWNIPLNIIYSTDSMTWLWEPGLHNVVGCIDAKQGLELPNWDTSLWFWVWPEWWWSEGETDFFANNGGNLWSFNSGILRLETASVVGTWILKYLFLIQK
jgi:RsmE family RNA methyltransferase